MDKTELFAYWPKANFSRYRSLINLFGNLENAWQAPEQELTQLNWRGEVLPNFLAWRQTAAKQAEILTKKLATEKITVLIYGSDLYPNKLFQDLTDPPYALFVRGHLNISSPTVAVVGSRLATPYGIRVLKHLLPNLIAQNITIVSGLAQGIDSTAHETALINSGYTVAVLGHGSDWSDFGTDERRRLLGKKIIDAGGAIVSEYLPGTPGTNYTFPARNRIIAALSQATLVIEAATGSGALITAQCARELHREILIVPHPIFSETGQGVNDQLKQGAHPITEARDIMEIMGITPQKNHPTTKPNFTPQEISLLNLVQTEPKDRDSLVRELGLTPTSLSLLLTTLEISGAIQAKNGLYYPLF